MTSFGVATTLNISRIKVTDSTEWDGKWGRHPMETHYLYEFQTNKTSTQTDSIH